MARKPKSAPVESPNAEGGSTSARQEVDHSVRKISKKSMQTIAHKITGQKGRLKFVNPKFNEIIKFEADCLFWLNGRLIHIEIQAQNDPDMHARMGTYAFLTLYQEKVLPDQYVIYVGEKPLKMPAGASSKDTKTNNQGTYIQPRLEWDARELLASNVPEEVIWAIFCGGLTKDKLVKAIFERINELKLSKKAKNEYFRAIELITNNTSLQKPVAKYMRIYGVEIDITKDRYYKVGKEQGIEEGVEKGIEKGKLYTAAELINSGLVSLEATTEKLKLNPDEVTQLQVIIKQMQNKQ
jgi:hypothetical protein